MGLQKRDLVHVSCLIVNLGDPSPRSGSWVLHWLDLFKTVVATAVAVGGYLGLIGWNFSGSA